MGDLPVVTGPDVPEPAAVVEAGVTTSEWKVLVAYATQLAATYTAALAARAGLNLPPEALAAVTTAEVLLGAAAISYILGRSIRKAGTAK